MIYLKYILVKIVQEKTPEKLSIRTYWKYIQENNERTYNGKKIFKSIFIFAYESKVLCFNKSDQMKSNY